MHLNYNVLIIACHLLNQIFPTAEKELAFEDRPGPCRLYDRRRKKITRNIVERISI
jgi:hypothetical protein